MWATSIPSGRALKARFLSCPSLSSVASFCTHRWLYGSCVTIKIAIKDTVIIPIEERVVGLALSKTNNISVMKSPLSFFVYQFTIEKCPIYGPMVATQDKLTYVTYIKTGSEKLTPRSMVACYLSTEGWSTLTINVSTRPMIVSLCINLIFFDPSCTKYLCDRVPAIRYIFLNI
jgi:hypothetical protein